MAIIEIQNTKLVRNEEQEIVEAVSVDITEGASVDYTNKSDGKILLMITNNNGGEDKKAIIKKGNALQGVEDLEISVPAGKTYCLVIESGKFANVSGDNNGKVVITGESTDIMVQAIELP